eukprot:CAMPEP_0180683786 /NCGR_PEP_ID=MMETSP1037_2-20121125/71400_1 /TAXON_ID=632150 /ORGANISM="Azadinium spinosum, Strain 3D9" /LENGTH=58 /DNA_ID=CAMNT_0022714117 /DNA_START=21 /DNA_END=194 /DNA_ORIENTATION=-
MSQVGPSSGETSAADPGAPTGKRVVRLPPGSQTRSPATRCTTSFHSTDEPLRGNRALP